MCRSIKALSGKYKHYLEYDQLTNRPKYIEFYAISVMFQLSATA